MVPYQSPAAQQGGLSLAFCLYAFSRFHMCPSLIIHPHRAYCSKLPLPLTHFFDSLVQKVPSVLTSSQPLSVESNLHQSAYGLGTWHDRLTLYAENRYSGGHCITPPIILSLVESLLGYELTYQESSRWVYRKDTPFKNL